jgi:hypothetical protein
MFYFAMAIITMFILSTMVFVAYNKKSFGVYDNEDLVWALLASLIASLLWVVTIPAFFIIGGAWFAAKRISSYYNG